MRNWKGKGRIVPLDIISGGAMVAASLLEKSTSHFSFTDNLKVMATLPFPKLLPRGNNNFNLSSCT